MDIRDLTRLEERLLREFDRRFSSLETQVARLDEKTDKRIDAMDRRIDDVNEKREDDKTWKLRYILGLLGSFIIGGGAITLIQYLVNSIKR